MITRSVAIFAAAIVAVFSTAAVAHPGGGMPGFFGGPEGGLAVPEIMVERLAMTLDLDDAQRDRIRNIIESARPEFMAIRDELRANREALESLDESDPGFAIVLEDIAMSNGQLATEATLVGFRVRSDIHAVLTDEQREKAERGKARMKEALRKRIENQ